MKEANSKILIINGSIRGMEGNSGIIANRALDYINSQKNTSASIITLTDPISNIEDIHNLLSAHDGFLVISGVYWNNWSSVLQRFIEVVTIFENSSVFFGKPIACAVSMDSVGGIEIASRIHTVFSSLGCWSPPCSTLVISRVGQEAVAATEGIEDDPNEDVWRLDDIEIIAKNLVLSTEMKCEWVQWPNVEFKMENGPWPHTGILNLDSPKFL